MPQPGSKPPAGLRRRSPVAHDIIASEDAPRLVAAQFHRHSFQGAGAHHVPDGRSAKVMRNACAVLEVVDSCLKEDLTMSLARPNGLASQPNGD